MHVLSVDQQISILLRADSMATLLNNDSQKNYIALKISELCLVSGHTDLAEKYLSSCVAISRTLGDSISLAVCYANLALLSSEAIMPDTAISYFEATKNIFKTR